MATCRKFLNVSEKDYPPEVTMSPTVFDKLKSELNGGARSIIEIESMLAPIA